MLRLAQCNFFCAGHSDELRTFTGNDAEECQQEGDHDDRKIIGFLRFACSLFDLFILPNDNVASLYCIRKMF